ncbi:MAG: ABC transporter substrate-binding protein [Chitinispirillaceae bacterium]|nr:ABC transporter substrate-binding protein [Chitinispirillaceae bacterium]
MLIPTILSLAAVLAVLVSCGTQQRDTEFSREKTLYIAGFQWGDPNSFNPLIDKPAWPIDGYFNLIYEPLMVFNTLNGKMEPLLARSYTNEGDRITVVMDSRARWSDGTPLTAADVKFTFDIQSAYPGAPYSYVWNHIGKVSVDSVSDSTGRYERVIFAVGKERNNPLVILDYLQLIRIIPKHIFEKLIDSLGDFSEVQKLSVDVNPVVSGPYNLFTYSNEKIVLKRRNDYWGYAALYGNRKPKPEYIIHPIYKSNDHISIELQQGGIDVSQSFIPRIWIKKQHMVATWYDKEPYFMPAAITMFLINTTRYPLSDRMLRRAMACAVNYTDINQLAITGYSPPLKPGLILPFGNEEQYFSEEDARKYGTVYDPQRAKKILAEAGYTSVFDQSGNLVEMKDPKGNRVPAMYITSPAGWTDWETAVKIAVRDMRTAGIDIREGFVDAASYFQRQLVGNFDLMMHTPSPYATPSKPWSRIEATMTARNWKPIGEKMYENWGRFNQPGAIGYIAAIDSLLTALPSMTDENEVKAVYRRLNVYFMEKQPTIPLFYRPEWFYEFSNRNWTNFPDAANPYTTPQCLCCGPSIRALWEISTAPSK